MNSKVFHIPKWLLGILFVALVLFIFRVSILEKIGSILVYQTELAPSDAIVVLAGSHTGNRIEEAARLYNKGLGKVVVFAGYTYYPGMDSNVGMKKYAIKLGIPEENIFTEMATGEDSTWGEALFNLGQLQRLKAKSLILVTSSYHTRRSHWVYERAIKKLNMDIDILVQPAHDPQVPIPGWWKVRTGKKKMLYEYIKTLYYSFSY